MSSRLVVTVHAPTPIGAGQGSPGRARLRFRPVVRLDGTIRMSLLFGFLFFFSPSTHTHPSCQKSQIRVPLIPEKYKTGIVANPCTSPQGHAWLNEPWAGLRYCIICLEGVAPWGMPVEPDIDAPPQRSFEQMKELAMVEPKNLYAPTYEEYLLAVRTQERLDRERFSST